MRFTAYSPIGPRETVASSAIDALILQTARDIAEQSGVNSEEFTSDLAPIVSGFMVLPDPIERWEKVCEGLAGYGVMIPDYIDMVMRRRIAEFVKLTIPTCTSCGDSA